MKNYNLIRLSLAVFVFLFTACSEDESQSRLRITSVSPNAAPPGSVVLISGKGFSGTKTENIVAFNAITAIVTQASPTELMVIVPQQATTGSITVDVKNSHASSKEDFQVTTPHHITSFSPTSGKPGDEVVITGTNFHAVAAENIVTFNDIVAHVIESSATQLTVIVPENATTGKISNQINGLKVSSESNFVITVDPVIESFSPITGAASTLITITGTNFGNDVNALTVKFNGTIAPDKEFQGNTLVVSVPAGATTGPITITRNGVTIASESDFHVWHSVTSFFPVSGKAGTEVTITGLNFDEVPTNNHVFFGGAITDVISASKTELVVYVPAQATTARIMIIIGAVMVNSPSDFLVTDAFESLPNTPGDPLLNPATTFVIGTKAYLGASGQLTNQSNLKAFWEYDPASGQWTQKADFEGDARNGASSFTLGLKGYVIGGFTSGTYKKDCWEYNPSTNRWVQKNDFNGTARAMATAFTIGTKAYFGLGRTAAEDFIKDVWEYNSSLDTWVRIHDLPANSTAGGFSFVINNEGYYGGGSTKDFWRYKPGTGWFKMMDLPDNGVASFSIRGNGYLNTWGGGLGKLWKYSPDNERWTAAANASNVGYYLNGFTVGNFAYLTLTSTSTQFKRYTPEQ